MKYFPLLIVLLFASLTASAQEKSMKPSTKESIKKLDAQSLKRAPSLSVFGNKLEPMKEEKAMEKRKALKNELNQRAIGDGRNSPTEIKNIDKLEQPK